MVDSPLGLYSQGYGAINQGRTHWATSLCGGIGDDKIFIQAEDCAIMKAMLDGNTQIRAIAVHVKHMIPSLNQ